MEVYYLQPAASTTVLREVRRLKGATCSFVVKNQAQAQGRPVDLMTLSPRLLQISRTLLSCPQQLDDRGDHVATFSSPPQSSQQLAGVWEALL